MSINIIVYTLLLFGAGLYSGRKSGKERKYFIIFCSLVLVLKAALRSVTIGSDTSHYSGYFYQSINRSWAEVFYLMQTETGIDDTEPGYKFIEKLFGSFFPNFNLYTFFVQLLLYYLPLGVLMYKETKTIREVLFGYVLLNTLFMGLPMANARQVYALGFCVWSYLFIVDKKFFLAVSCVFVAYFIHHSSLLFLLMLIIPLIPLKILKYTVWGAIGLSPLILVSAGNFILLMAVALGSDKYATRYGEQMQGGGVNFTILSILLCVFAAIALLKCQEPKIKMKLYYGMITYTALSAPLIYSSGSMMRITMYFQLFFIMLIPKLIDIYFPKEKKKVFLFLILFLIVFSVVTEVPYKFFWEENQDPYKNWS